MTPRRLDDPLQLSESGYRLDSQSAGDREREIVEMVKVRLINIKERE